MTRLLFLLAVAFAISGVVGAANKAAPTDNTFSTRCRASGVVMCVALDSEAEIARLRTVPKHLSPSTRIQWDPEANAARFTIPPNSPADSSGQLYIRFPHRLTDVYVSFDVRYPASLLDYKFKGGGGWKFFILGQGAEGCAPYEVVGNNPYHLGYPSFYYICGSGSGAVAVQDPFGDNSSQFDYQPGGDTACLRNPRPDAKPCAYFPRDTWVTYQVHVNALAKHLEVWQAVGGKTLKLINFHLDQLPQEPPAYEWIALTPYNTGKDASESHPPFVLWYRRLIVSTARIPDPRTGNGH